jgi:hypothetical protein
VGSGEAEITPKPREVSVDTLFTTFTGVPLTLVPDSVLCTDARDGIERDHGGVGVELRRLRGRRVIGIIGLLDNVM